MYVGRYSAAGISYWSQSQFNCINSPFWIKELPTKTVPMTYTKRVVISAAEGKTAAGATRGHSSSSAAATHAQKETDPFSASEDAGAAAGLEAVSCHKG